MNKQNLLNATAFVERVGSDPTLQRYFSQRHASGDEMRQWATANGYHFTETELHDALAQWLHHRTAPKSALEDTDLSEIVGGLATLRLPMTHDDALALLHPHTGALQARP